MEKIVEGSENLDELNRFSNHVLVEGTVASTMALEVEDTVTAETNESKSVVEHEISSGGDIQSAAGAIPEDLQIASELSPNSQDSISSGENQTLLKRLVLSSNSETRSDDEEEIIPNNLPEKSYQEVNQGTRAEESNDQRQDSGDGLSDKFHGLELQETEEEIADLQSNGESFSGEQPKSRRLRIDSDSDQESENQENQLEDSVKTNSVEKENSDSTSSDDEPPPAIGRWMTSGGAARKTPRTPGVTDVDGIGDEGSPKASRRTKANAENLIAIHSESQRLVREADANLPYHEPKQFSKFSEFKAMLEEEEENGSPIIKRRHHRRKRRSPEIVAPDPPPAEEVEGLVAQKVATAEWIESLPSKPPSPSSEPLACKPEELAQGENFVSSTTVSPVVKLKASTPYHSKTVADQRKLILPVPEINFDVDLDMCSVPDQSSIHGSSEVNPKEDGMVPLAERLAANPSVDLDAQLVRTLHNTELNVFNVPDQSSIHGSSEVNHREDEMVPLAERLTANPAVHLDKRLVRALRNTELNSVPKLGSPDSSGFIDLQPRKEHMPDESFESTGSTHPMLRRLRRHMKPKPREAKRNANKSIEIITKSGNEDGENLKLEEVRLMPPPPNPPRLSAASRASNWKAHRQQLQEEMRVKRLKGLEERQRRWAMYHNEEFEGTKKVRSLDDMDSDDEEFVPGEESDDESSEEDEDEDIADDEDEDEEEEERRRRAGKSEFIDEEAEEEDEEPKFDGTLPNSPIDLRLCEEDDEVVMADDRPSCKSASLYSRKLSLTSTTRDLFASDPDEISSMRSSVSSIFQPGQRSFILPDEPSMHSEGSNRRISESYQLAEGRAPEEATLVWNEQQGSVGFDDPYEELSKGDSASREPTPMASPVKLSTQGARSLFHMSQENWLDGDMDDVAADLFMKTTQTGSQLSQEDMFSSSLSQRRNSFESAKESSKELSNVEEDEDDVVVHTKRKSQVLSASSDEEEEAEPQEEDSEAEPQEEDSGAELEEAEAEEEEAEAELEEEDEEDEEVVDEDDDEMAVMRRIEGQTARRPPPRIADFVEQEAELSGSDGDVSSDENEQGLDRDDDTDTEWIDKDPSNLPPDAQLRHEVERVHARMERDDHQRAVRYLQELYLPDGDLTPGESLRRRFRWRGLEDKEDDEEMGPYIESEDEDEENQVSFVDDQRPAGNLNVSAVSGESGTVAGEEEESQLLRLGETARQTKVRPATVSEASESQINSRTCGFGLTKRGSFLSKATSDLGRIRDILRQSDYSSLRNKAGVVCFSVGAEPLGKKQTATKRPSTERYESGKKPCLSGKPLTSMNSIFNSIDGK